MEARKKRTDKCMEKKGKSAGLQKSVQAIIQEVSENICDKPELFTDQYLNQ